jgi:hypothetical protein
MRSLMRASSQRFLGALIAATAAVQLWMCHRYRAFLTGDEVEVLAEAFRRALPFRYEPWEIRCLFVSDVLVAPFVKAASLLGIEQTRWLIDAATLPFIVLTAFTIVLVHELTLRWTEGDEVAARIAATLFAFHWIPLAFGATTYPRTLATACIVAAALLAERRPFLAGALLGLAFADRFSEIVFLLPLLFLARKNWWRLLVAAAVSIAIIAGGYDWITYGHPFRSVYLFAQYTLVQPDFASRVKYQAPWWYLANLARWCALTLLPLLWFARKRAPWLFVVVPLIALSAIRHKELRYLQAIIPFLAIAAGIGAAILWQSRRRIAIALVALSIVWNLVGIRYSMRKSMPAVAAAELLGRDPSVQTVTLTQNWAYGDKLYFGDAVALRDVGTPIVIERFAAALPGSDAVALFESDIDEPVLATLRNQGFVNVRTFRDGPARAVVLFRRASR